MKWWLSNPCLLPNERQQTGLGKDSLKVHLWMLCRTDSTLASFLPQFKKCKSFTAWGLDLNDRGAVPSVRVGISQHANFFHENLPKLAVMCAAQIAANTQAMRSF